MTKLIKSKAFYTLLALVPPALLVAAFVLNDVNYNVVEAQAQQTAVATTN